MIRCKSASTPALHILHLFYYFTLLVPLLISFLFTLRTSSNIRIFPCAIQLWASRRIIRPEKTASDTARSANMAASGAGGFAPVLAALSTMQSNAERSQKSQAHEYLEKFQKSVRRIRTTSIRSFNEPY